MKVNKKMNWIPLYVTGKRGFQHAVTNALEHSGVRFMPGYLQDDLQPGEHALYWIDESVSLQQVKKAITAKLIFKYRLRFFSELDEFISQHRRGNEIKLTAIDFKM
jgi:hypothetical protein